MKRLLAAAALAAALSTSACGTFTPQTITAAATLPADASFKAAQTEAQAENFYIGYGQGVQTARRTAVLNDAGLAQAKAIDNKLYAALVAARVAEKGADATTLQGKLDAFNALLAQGQALGIKLPSS